MYIPGHLSVGYLCAAVSTGVRGRAPRFRTEILPVLLGALTPDIVDKSIELAGLYEHSRGAGHSLLFVALAWLLWQGLERGGSAAGRPLGMWLLGIVSHFAADLGNDLVRSLLFSRQAFSTWFAWPWATPEAWALSHRLALFPGVRALTPFEVAIVLVAVATAWRLHSRRAPPDSSGPRSSPGVPHHQSSTEGSRPIFR